MCARVHVSGTQVTKIKLHDFTETLIPLVFWKRSDYPVLHFMPCTQRSITNHYLLFVIHQDYRTLEA